MKGTEPSLWEEFLQKRKQDSPGLAKGPGGIETLGRLMCTKSYSIYIRNTLEGKTKKTPLGRRALGDTGGGGGNARKGGKKRK